MRLLGERIESAAAGPGGQDYKTRLQELSARSFDQLPVYLVSDDGPDHAKEFHAVVHVQGRAQGDGPGPLQEAGRAGGGPGRVGGPDRRRASRDPRTGLDGR